MNNSTDPDQRTASTIHAARLAAGAACLDAALTLYLPRGLVPTCCCDPDHIGVGKKHSKACTSPGKAPMHPWKALQTTIPTEADVRALWGAYPIGNVGCVLGQASGVVRIDSDGTVGEALLQAWSGGDLPRTWTFRSSEHGRGLLYAWPKNLPCKSTTRPAPGEHQELRLQANGAQTVLPPSRHVSGSVYTWDPGLSPTDLDLAPAPAWLIARLQVTAKAKEQEQRASSQPTAPPRAVVQEALFAIANSGEGVDYDTWLKVGMALNSLQTDVAWDLWDTWSQQSSKYQEGKQAVSWASFHPDGTVQIDTLFALARKHGWADTPPPWAHSAHHGTGTGSTPGGEQGTGKQGTGKQGTEQETASDWEPAIPAPRPWPEIEKAAYYGLAGEIVQTIAPHTEGDPVAVLVQFLAMFGNCLGRSAYFPVGADAHYPTLFVCLVGKSSRGRKGTAAGYPRRVLAEIDPQWSKRIMGGLSSGEGVIWQVRDPIGEEGDKRYDPGADDKRLCVLETEFARALSKMSQEGNVLSAVLRQAWDHGTLRSLTSGRTHAPVQATDAHVSVITHITAAELQRLLAESEAANGFGNRFLWCCVKRSKLLPHGGDYPQALRPLQERLRKALAAARTTARMQRSPAAATLWERYYAQLTEEHPGLLGDITSRAEAQVLRLSCLYGLLDSTDTIRPEHLDAAVAVWRYSEASAAYIFGDMLGSPLADELLRMIRMAGRTGITRTEMSNALGRNIKSAVIGHALALLLREHLAFARQTRTEEQKRPTETWYQYELHEFNEFNRSESEG